VSSLAALLSTLKDSRSERVFFAPGEVPRAMDGENSRALDGAPLAASVLLSAASEILSLDEVRDLPSSRPRIVRYEFDGEDYIIEVARRPAGVAIGARLAKSTLRRDGVPEPSRDVRMGSVRQAAEPPPLEPAPPPSLLTPAKLPAPGAVTAEPPADPAGRRGSRRPRALREKHTIRVELDEEGNPIDATAIDLDAKLDARLDGTNDGNTDRNKDAEPSRPTRRLSKPFKQPSALHAAPRGTTRVYETHIVPRAGEPATNTEIAGSPNGAYVTFLFAPAGFSIVVEGEGAVVVAKTDDAAIRGELYVGPSMKLRIAQGAKESLVTFYRRNPSK
jgi:hypothetical protein